MTNRPNTRSRVQLTEQPLLNDNPCSFSGLSSISESSSSDSGSSSDASTVVEFSQFGLSEDAQQLETLQQSNLTQLEATPTQDLTSIDCVKELAEQAHSSGIDPNLLFMAKLFSQKASVNIPVQQPQSLTRFETLAKQIGSIKEGEDIFVFLHRFEFQLKSQSVPHTSWLSFLPSVLSGVYSEAYYNNITVCANYSDMRIVLLNTGGYSLAECLNSFPLKYRTSGSKSMLQWFNHWSYKFGVILNSFSFLSGQPDKSIESISQIFASVGILAGLPSDARESVLSRKHASVQAFLQDCNSVCQFSEPSHRPNSHSHSVQSQHRSFSNNHHGSHDSYRNQRTHSNSNSFHSNRQHSHSNYHSHSNSHQPNHHRQSPPRRDLSTVTCYKCNALGHYANNCPAVLVSQSVSRPTYSHSQSNQSNQHNQSNQANQLNQSTQSIQSVPATVQQSNYNSQPVAPVPVPRNKPRSVRKINYTKPDCVPDNCDSVSDSDSTDVPTHLNCFDDEFITHGSVNGIPTLLVVDSGAKISIMSTDFLNDTMTPISHQNIFGISQVSISAPVYEVPVVLPTLNGLCRLAVDSRPMYIN